MRLHEIIYDVSQPIPPDDDFPGKFEIFFYIRISNVRLRFLQIIWRNLSVFWSVKKIFKNLKLIKPHALKSRIPLEDDISLR